MNSRNSVFKRLSYALLGAVFLVLFLLLSLLVPNPTWRTYTSREGDYSFRYPWAMTETAIGVHLPLGLSRGYPNIIKDEVEVSVQNDLSSMVARLNMIKQTKRIDDEVFTEISETKINGHNFTTYMEEFSPSGDVLLAGGGYYKHYVAAGVVGDKYYKVSFNSLFLRSLILPTFEFNN